MPHVISLGGVQGASAVSGDAAALAGAIPGGAALVALFRLDPLVAHAAAMAYVAADTDSL